MREVNNNPPVKFRDIHRSVRPRQYVRSAGDAPNIGRVARVPGTGMPKGERRLRKRSDRRGRGLAERVHRRNVIIAWSALLSAVTIAVLLFFVGSWLRGQMDRTVAGAGAAGDERQWRNVSQFESPTDEAALALVKHSMQLRDPVEALAYFHPGSVGPGEVVRFLAGMEKKDGPITGYQWLSRMDANGLQIEGVLVTTALDDKPRNRLALLTPDELGIWKIDFEAFARSTDPAWPDILSEEGGKGTVRVIVAKDHYHNGPFRDETEWVCYGMASPDIDAILLGYCRVGSEQARAMERLFPKAEENDEARPRQQVIRATLALERPPEAEMRQFEITGVLAEDWILSERPFDSPAG